MLTRNGYIYQTSSAFTTVTSLVLQRWLDKSTSIISQEKSIFKVPDRLIQIGENTTAQLIFEARDGFGAQMPLLSGGLCRFTIVTNRGVLDGDDAALSANVGGPFRTGNDVPVARQVDVAFDGSGVAIAYFQSARRSGAQSVEDIVRVIYPAQ